MKVTYTLRVKGSLFSVAAIRNARRLLVLEVGWVAFPVLGFAALCSWVNYLPESPSVKWGSRLVLGWLDNAGSVCFVWPLVRTHWAWAQFLPHPWLSVKWIIAHRESIPVISPGEAFKWLPQWAVPACSCGEVRWTASGPVCMWDLYMARLCFQKRPKVTAGV